MTEPQYTEHDKMRAVHDQSQACAEFLIWLEDEKKLHLGRFLGNSFYPASEKLEKLLAEFFDIDLDKIEAEKRAMLAELRNNN